MNITYGALKYQEFKTGFKLSIVTVIQDEKEAAALVRLGFQFARANQCPFIIVYAHESDKDAELSEFDLETETNDNVLSIIKTTFLEEKEQALDISQTPHYEYHDEEEITTTMMRVPDTEVKIANGRNLSQPIFKTISSHSPELLIIGRHESLKGKKHLTDILFEKAHCSTMIIRLGENDYKRCKKLLLPCSGGPHIREALILTSKLSESQGTVIHPLIVEPNTTELMEEVGVHTLENFIKSCGLQVSNTLEPKAVIKDDVMEGICEAADDDYDLVIMGATEGGNLRKKLFGNLSEKIFRSSPKVSVAVYRARKSKLKVLRDKIEYWCNVTIPQMDRETRVKLYENLYVNSTWNFDFISLICLSTAIAALGLISNSTAVVIGAMLVAPLMVPILGAGLAIIQGNVPLVVNSAKSIILGFLAALGIGFLVGVLTPYDELTSEILARGKPRLADMFIAFFSGVAAAHCMSRPKLSAALPGVAIAAALVPPIASSGLALSLGKPIEASGATILFFTNVVCIILGSSFTFFAAGVRYNKKRSSNRWVQQAYIGLIVALSLLVIPLSSTLMSKVTEHFSTSIKLDGREKYRIVINEIIKENPDSGVISFDNPDISIDKTKMSIKMECSKLPSKELVAQIESAILEKLKKTIKVRLVPTIIVE